MKRWTLRILLCVILITGGAITTVAVAWGTHYWPYDGSQDSGVRSFTGTSANRAIIERGTVVIPMSAGWPTFAIYGIEGTRPQPIWSGFLINTLFYAAIWFGVFFGLTSAKRLIRSKRGRCPRCGYDLRGHRQQGTEASRHQGLGAGCPECGWGR